MATNLHATAREPRRARREVVRLIRQIQELTLELDALRNRPTSDDELQAKERAREQLRWRLAAVARHAASDDG